MGLHKISLQLLGICFLISSLAAQEKFPDLPEISDAYVIRNATVTVRPGVALEDHSVLIEHGLIKAVGRNIEAPVYAKEIRGDSLHIYAGFIAGLSHIGVPPEKKEDEDNGEKRTFDPGNPPEKEAGMQPGVEVAGVLHGQDNSIDDFRKAGITIAHTVSRGGMLPGSGALILLTDADEKPLVLKDRFAQFAQLKGARGIYPNTVIGVMAKFRELFRQAGLYADHKTLFASNPDITAPRASEGVKALVEVQDGSLPLYFKAPQALDMHRVIQLQEDLGFRLVLSETKQAWRVIPQLKSTFIPILISLDLPEDKEETKESDEEKPGKETEETPDTVAKPDTVEIKIDPEIQAMKEKRKESRLEYLGQGASLRAADIPFGVSLLDVKAGDVLLNLRLIAEQGLDSESVLSALTTYPASLLGIEQYAGTVEKGKLANLAVFTAPFLEKDAHLQYVFVNGELFTYEKKPKKKKDDAKRKKQE